MNSIIWILVTSYVALGTALFYGLAIDSVTMSLGAAASLALLGVLQRLLLSRRSGRSSGPGRVRSDRSSR